MKLVSLAFCLTSFLMKRHGLLQADHLGENRASFGDITRKSIPPKGEALSSWRYRSGLGERPTEIYFPIGRADERFFLNYIPTRNSKGQEHDTWVLQFEKSKDGIVSLEWSIPLEAHMCAPVYIPGYFPDEGGSILRMLGRRGLYLARDPDKKVAQRLSIVEGYAGYWKVTPVSSTLLYWYCDPDGQASKAFALDLSGVKQDRIPGFPSLSIPYPITPFELEAIKNQK